MNGFPSTRLAKGFTLLEIMLVLLLMGLMMSYVLMNSFSVSQSDRLKEQATRLQVILDMASDYAVLNQLQLGLRIEETDRLYYFVALDEDDNWQRVEGNKLYQEHVLPEGFSFILELEDLPWESGERLFDRELFDETLSVSEDRVSIGDEEEEKIPPPQILIMSSGELTPFSIQWQYEPEFGADDPVYFYLNNEDVPPLTLEGPLEQPNDNY